MAEADLSVGPPGVPDKFGGGAAALEAELVDDELQDDTLDLATIKGLVLGAAGVLHQSLTAQYPERPDVAVMEEGEAEKIATALLSMSRRHPGLRMALEKADAAMLATVLLGYTGPVTADIAGARRERRKRGDTGENRGVSGAGGGAPNGMGGGPGLRVAAGDGGRVPGTGGA